MSFNHYLSTAALALVFIILFRVSVQASEVTREQVIGQWAGARHLNTFYPDGTFCLEPDPSDPAFRLGTWKVEGGNLIKEFKDSGNERMRISLLGASRLKIESNGRTYIWKKVLNYSDPAMRSTARPVYTPLPKHAKPEPSTGTVAPDAGRKAFTPKTGDPTRSAILDVMRLTFYRGDAEAAHRNPKQHLFKVVFLRVAGDWACVCVEGINPGTEPSWEVLQRRGGTWAGLKYFDTIIKRDNPDEEAAHDALDMSPETIQKVRTAFPDAPADIFPKPGEWSY